MGLAALFDAPKITTDSYGNVGNISHEDGAKSQYRCPGRTSVFFDTQTLSPEPVFAGWHQDLRLTPAARRKTASKTNPATMPVTSASRSNSEKSRQGVIAWPSSSA